MVYKFQSIDEIFKEYKTSTSGISDKEAEERIRKYGKNEIKLTKEITIFQIFFNQFKNILLIPLIIATIIYFLIGDIIESIVIFIIIIFILLIGTIQEFQAENAVRALKKMETQYARVIRKNQNKTIPSNMLVPGDLIVINAGDKIPADCRIIESYNLKINEAPLTGESIPVSKDKNGKTIEETILYSSTYVTSGTGKAIVIATGENTEFGKISKLLKPKIELTPLQKQIRSLTIDVGIIVATIVLISGVIMFLKAYPFFDIITTTSALLIAGVPEALPFVMILTLSLGVLKMSKKNSIIRKMIAIEALGSINYICTDKTGTLTKNEMIVKKIWQNGKIYEITGKGYEPYGKFYLNETEVKIDNDLKMLLRAGVECNNAILKVSKNKIEIQGDPTEVAILVAARKAGIKPKLNRIYEIPFESDRKLMSVVCKIGNKKIMFTKGALESILKKSKWYYKNGNKIKLTHEKIKKIISENEEITKVGFRTLGIAYSEIKNNEKKYEENNLIFLGFFAMHDPLRENILESIRLCKKAGIKVVMITGDNKETAKSIAEQLEILENNGKILTGDELDNLSEKEFLKIVEKVSVYARVTPEHKYKIVEALQRKGNVVAVTGDGINDAPALQKATIGVAMGKIGTDVAKESSKMIIKDDNFATIVEAIKEGRNIYDNIRKFTFYLLSCNFTEILFVVFAIVLEYPLPLLALQIIWLNLITDEIPAMGLSVDQPHKTIMERPPRNPKEKIIRKSDFIMLFLLSSYMMFCLMNLFIFELPNGIEKARTITLATFAFFELFNAINCRNLEESIFKIGLFKNKQLIFAILASLISLILIIYIPSLQIAFKTTPLNIQDWIVIILLSISIIPFFEIIKLFKRRILKI
ncbi:MAG: cation-translocating P-type ATPase [Candidatus Aenigmarchaeota archaeon]|nr:cation-translocating P-type ATPase [Candidatus Aenigmarchaeota archaeon]